MKTCNNQLNFKIHKMKKISLYIIAGLSLFSCVDDDVSGLADTSETNVIAPVAVDDEIFVVMNTPLKIENLLDNDTISNYGRISSIDFGEEGKGAMEPQGNGGYKYIPKEGFIGETSFIYELCDENFPANCTIATVRVVVTEEFLEFKANDDFVVVDFNQNSLIDTLLSNDLMAENAVIESIDVSNTIGAASLVGNNIEYVPVNDFIGEDTLVYNVCNTTEDGVEQCDTATVRIVVANTVNFTINSEVSAYYQGIEFYDSPDYLLETFKNLMISSHVNILEYTDRHDYLYDADEDLMNPDNVTLIYSSESRFEEEYQGNANYEPLTFNTEHIYPQSFLPGEDQSDPSTRDLHNLRVVDASTNSSRSNHPFVDGSGVFMRIDDTWYPGDEWKGDVARIVMYMNMYYDEPFQDVGNLDLFLQWNIEDPVSDFEMQRNNVIEGAQGNRNPFIDNPFLATLIWGGDAAVNTWE